MGGSDPFSTLNYCSKPPDTVGQVQDYVGLAWLTLQMYTEGKMMSERGDVVDSMLVTVPELTKDSTFWKRSLTGTPLNRLLHFVVLAWRTPQLDLWAPALY